MSELRCVCSMTDWEGARERGSERRKETEREGL